MVNLPMRYRATSLLLGMVLFAGVVRADEPVSLPGPIVNPFSFALLANSRYSVISGFLPDLPKQVLANVTWAMSRAPRLGETRELYVATAENVYRYDPETHELQLHLPGDNRYNSGSAFEIGVATDVPEDAGSAVQSGLLAATAFREDFGVAACPMSWATDHANANWEPAQPIRMATVFGRAESRVMDTTLAVRAIDPSLVEPVVVGPDSFEIVMMALRQDTLFASWDLSRETISQLLWAASGPTPHRTINDRPGLTIPGGLAGYPQTTGIYLVQQQGVFRYRLVASPPASRIPAFAGHRLETRSGFDRRDELRAAVPVPATAPDYFVITVPDPDNELSRQEAGIVGFQLLAQARALGLTGRLIGPLGRSEIRAVTRLLELPRSQVPIMIFAAGEAVEPTEDVSFVRPQPGTVEIIRAAPVLRRGETIRIDYLLRVPGTVRVEVFDMLGRPVRQLPEVRLTAGYHSVEWDGTGTTGTRVKPGSYIIGIFGPGAVGQHKLSVL